MIKIPNRILQVQGAVVTHFCELGDRIRQSLPSPPANDLQFRGVTQGDKVESGAGQACVEQSGLVLHPPEPGLDHRDQFAEAALDQIGEGTMS